MTDPSSLATWREIHAQPRIWRDWGAALDVPGLRAWVAAQAVQEVWFCGAGSSAYVGEIVAAALEGGPGPALRACATTDLVSHPHRFLRGRRPLVVSFGRSGNSAETVGLLDALDALAPEAPRLNITCNAGSALAARPGRFGRVVLLPEATHDAGFAMTSSFTTMLLTALAVFDRGLEAAAVPGRMAGLADALEAQLGRAEAAGPLPERAVFVGAGALAFAAREAALKVLELSAGQIPALWESTLGFRHGPKSFVRGDTAIHVLRAPDAHARAYDDDLLAELAAQFPAARVIGVDLALGWPDGWGAVLPVVQAQRLAVGWSRALGLPVDDPFAGQGTLTRVVSGVKLHPVAP
jgi:tagatose-6-phosphate ketose/aldose isomerase